MAGQFSPARSTIMEHGGIQGIIDSKCAPGKLGGKKGPGCSLHKPVFNRPDPENDYLFTARKMEEAGQMTPEMAQVIKAKIEDAKAQPKPKTDYGNEGHDAD